MPIVSLSALLFYSCQITKQNEITSPDGTIKTIVNSEKWLTIFCCFLMKDTILTNSTIDIALKGFDKLDNFEIISLTKNSCQQHLGTCLGKTQKGNRSLQRAKTAIKGN